jgi:large subunit ribosomal protein L4
MADTQTLEAPAYTALGTERERIALPETLFDGTVNMPVMHQAVKAFLANQRQGNAATKIRKYVTGGNQKPWKQKGTGRARQGSTRAPHWVGGGTVFGPQPRSYAQFVPAQVRALARKSAFNARARENAIFVIDQFNFDAPKTRRLQDLVDRLGVGARKVLILTDGVKRNVYLSGRNMPFVNVLPYSDVSTYHILWSDVVLIESSALGATLEPVEETEPTERPARAKRPTRRGAKLAAAAAEDESEERPTKRKKRAAKTARKAAAPRAAKKKKTAAKKKSAKKKSAATKAKGGAKKKAAKPKKKER